MLSYLQAVQQGRWLVIEDINLAPPDVLAALIPLLESGRLHLSQRAESIQAAPGFQLLATVTCSPGLNPCSHLSQVPMAIKEFVSTIKNLKISTIAVVA